MSPSPLLVAEASSSLSEPVAAALLTWIAVVVVLRMSVLVERARLDWAAVVLIGSFWCIALLRDRAVQEVLTRWISLADVRLAAHTAALVGAGAILWIGLLWRARRPVRGCVVPLISVSVAVLAGALAWISTPARAVNVAIEELSGWRPGVYMTVYSLPTMVAEILPLITALSLIWNWQQNRARAALGATIAVCVALSWIDGLTRTVTGWMISAGVPGQVGAERAEHNDLLFLLPVALLMLLGMPSIATSLAIRLGKDSASRNIRVLGPMWEDMMAARPEMRLNVRARNTLPQVTEHRMRIEIEDTMISVAPWLTCLDPDPTPPQVCQALRAAYTADAAEQGDQAAAAPLWVGDEKFVLEIAREWARTRSTQVSPL
ncbi:DUF6545 domain-containing protein [Nocardia sp. CNY236]|uniref:DUF6545 domain-containing protein n=1 Tax=Nocardia sp. CNY236 TaxID=1169152 RepID=UPI00048BBCE6|nr:DUF6545 domain-containing protein [Nocardia sp. CNY236]